MVVPESLEADLRGRPTGRPSFVYAEVLDYVRRTAGERDDVYLAPANAFGGDVREEIAAWRHLEATGPRFRIHCPGINLGPYDPPGAYIDTLGNAFLLSRLIDPRAEEYHLVAAGPHMRRAAWCFERAGFILGRRHPVPVRGRSGRVVKRTCYYRHPMMHHLYESLAYVRDRWIKRGAGRDASLGQEA